MKKTVTRILQGVAACAVATIPVWIDAAINKDVTYGYLLHPPYLYQVMGVALFLVFLPELVHFATRAFGALLPLMFAAYYGAFRGRIAVPMAGLLAWAAVTIGLANFVLGTKTYLYSVAREIHHSAEINRQLLITSANEAAEKAGTGSELPILKTVLRVYPEDSSRNRAIARRVKLIEESIDISTALDKRGDELVSADRFRDAIDAYAAAHDVWPQDGYAESRLETLRSRFERARNALVVFYYDCHTLRLQDEVAFETALPLVVRDASDVRTAISQKKSDEDKAKVLSRICLDVVSFSSPDAYVSETRSTLFPTDLQ